MPGSATVRAMRHDKDAPTCPDAHRTPWYQDRLEAAVDAQVATTRVGAARISSAVTRRVVPAPMNPRFDQSGGRPVAATDATHDAHSGGHQDPDDHGHGAAVDHDSHAQEPLGAHRLGEHGERACWVLRPRASSPSPCTWPRNRDLNALSAVACSRDVAGTVIVALMAVTRCRRSTAFVTGPTPPGTGRHGARDRIDARTIHVAHDPAIAPR